jgi:cytochrome oxidase Cu insertion factor (SCO1/SenC/PrrC family)
MDQQSNRRKLIALAAVVGPILVGILIVLIGHLAGHEAEVAKPAPKAQRPAAIAPAAAGTPAPLVRLAEGASGKSFDSASLGNTPYAVVFISTKCGTVGDYLGRAVAELREGQADAAVLAISSDPTVDTPQAVGAFLSRHHLEGAPFHYLVGDEAELRGYWNAWGLTEPSATCPGSVPAHLVNGSVGNAGVVDLDPDSAPSLFSGALIGMSK